MVAAPSDSLRLAIVGPGRIGTALAARWVTAGVELLGFLGRDPERAARAVALAGAGQVLRDATELGAASAVLLAVPGAALAELSERLAPVAAAGSVWFHASGAHDLAVLAPLAATGVHVGSFHPLCPVTEAEAGRSQLAGQPAVLQGDEPALAVLEDLAGRAEMRAVRLPDTDRVLYHAACNLAANGAIALLAAAEQILRQGCGLAGDEARLLPHALVRAALAGVAERGPAGALSGPVRRADGATLQRHAQHLGRSVPELLAVYRALMTVAVEAAAVAGELSEEQRLDLLARLLD